MGKVEVRANFYKNSHGKDKNKILEDRGVSNGLLISQSELVLVNN
jgi:hypothetical protein